MRKLVLLTFVLLPTLAWAPIARAASPGLTCERTAADNLRSCVRRISVRQQRCYRDTGSACVSTDTKIIAAFANLASRVAARCPDQATVTAAGYSAALTPAGLVDRLEEACGTAAASVAARSYGGPHAAVRSSASETDQKCLDRTYSKSSSLVDYELRQQSRCVRNVHAGKLCDTVDLATKISARELKTRTQIESSCPTPTQSLVGIDAAAMVSRAAAQSRCLAATAHGSTAPLNLDCGPRAAVPVPPRATNTQVVLPSATWGTRCGNGSDYAFRIRLAPTGSPVERVVVFMQGGGACYDGPGCAAQSPGLFEALSDNLPTGGMMSNTAATNPFRDWTKVFLPYCTQDLHSGGGIASVYTETTVQRYGALNVRGALQYVRDVLWAEMDASDPAGYRGDRVLTVFSGSSAGGYGAAYNYHWLLDDLAWPHSTLAPDAGLGMDNGVAGVILLGSVAQLPTSPGWNTVPYMPPYCFTPACMEVYVNLENATAPRLLRAPEQQVLHVSNQIDNTQISTTLFSSTAAWVNTLRQSYCSVQGTPGLHSFFNASSTSVHGQITTNAFDNVSIDGTTMRDWLGDAMANPAGVTDRTATGTLEVDYPGVLPFPCTLGSPSGAFLDLTALTW